MNKLDINIKICQFNIKILHNDIKIWQVIITIWQVEAEIYHHIEMNSKSIQEIIFIICILQIRHVGISTKNFNVFMLNMIVLSEEMKGKTLQKIIFEIMCHYFNKKDFQNLIAWNRTFFTKVCLVPSEKVLLIFVYVVVSDAVSFVKPSK